MLVLALLPSVILLCVTRYFNPSTVLDFAYRGITIVIWFHKILAQVTEP
jgi:hypothetical protein